MSNHSPVKTALGQDELRHRTRGLGQRYRTVLLLVDGRRPLGDVLAMAHKAGAQTSHFEELVRMGLVEVPSDVAAPEPPETEPGALDTPRLTSVELDVYADEAAEPADEAPAADAREAPLPGEVPLARAEPPAPTPAASVPTVSTVPTAPEGSAPPAPRRVFEDAPASPGDVQMGSAHGLPMFDLGGVPEAPSAPPSPAAAAAGSHYQAPTVALSDTLRAPEWTQQVRETPFKVADHARAAPSMTEEQRLQYVRDLLLDTLRRDSLLFSSFSTARVRAATTHKDLIKLVWDIERDRSHPRRNRDQLLNLQRARELLGMGNTLVAGDSQPGSPPSEF